VQAIEPVGVQAIEPGGVQAIEPGGVQGAVLTTLSDPRLVVCLACRMCAGFLRLVKNSHTLDWKGLAC